ncbi:response regulator [Vibrio agarivorans]|uniref:Response regulator n=1 Tax=Vibrio agarivorans TaxID=153622 RepID=A0ABT7Y3F0_9VIBR|nr:response regulator [Vibrio agarivorans]
MKNNNKNQSLARLSVLVVDDCNTTLLLFKQQLKQIGVTKVSVATNYQEALQSVGAHRYDIIILDYHLDKSVTGSQLASIFYRRKLISRSTGLLLVSGDTSQEAVLTGLSGHVPHFMKKPFQPSDLAKRLVQVYLDQSALRKLEDILLQVECFDELGLVNIVAKAPTPILAESYVLQTLIKQARWDCLSQWLSHSPTPVHVQKLIAKAQLQAQHGEIARALLDIEDYIRDNPLAIHAMDLATQFYTESNNFHEAFHYAKLAFDKTPSISSRAIAAARLATELNKWDVLLEIGRAYANSLSVADVTWISSMLVYGKCLQNALTQILAASKRDSFVLSIQEIFDITYQRLSATQCRSMDLYKQLFLIGVRKEQQRHKEAKAILIQTVLPYIDEVATIPTCLLIECYFHLDFYQEAWFAEKVSTEIENRNLFDDETEELLQEYRRYRGIQPQQTSASQALSAVQAP